MSRLTSQLAIVCGFLGISLMVMALFGGSWLYCQEKAIVEKNTMVDVAFRIGLWKVCPINPNNNASETCKLIHLIHYSIRDLYNVSFCVLACLKYTIEAKIF